MLIPTDWLSVARDNLLRMRGNQPGWGYRPSGLPSIEPTVLSCLALMSTGTGKSLDHVSSAASWLASIQQPNGSLGLSGALPTPTWPTPLAILIWAAIGEYGFERKKAADWLLRVTSLTYQREPNSPSGNDPTISGWPWVDGYYPWVEPTSWTILALCHEGFAQHPRTIEGIKLIRDRAFHAGGWNYGNSSAFGRELLPQPAPTGLALLALRSSAPRDGMVEKACAYLAAMLPKIRSPQSLCCSVLGLNAWGVYPAETSCWFAEAWNHLRPDSSSRVLELAYLLLGAGECSLRVLGADTDRL